MSMLGSGFGRALGAAGGVAAGMASKYIDEEIANNRATFLAELQRTSARGIREDQASFDDTRAPVVRAQRAEDLKSAAGTQDMIELGRLNNGELRGAKRTAADEDAAAATAREIAAGTARAGDAGLNTALRDKMAADTASKEEAERKALKTRAGDKEAMQAERAIKLNDPIVEAQIMQMKAAAGNQASGAALHRAQLAGVDLNNADKRKLDTLTKEADSIIADQDLSDVERGKKLSTVFQRASLIDPRFAKKTDTESDTVKIEEKMVDQKTGNETTTTRTEKRRAGQGGGKPEEADPILKALEANRASREKAAKPQVRQESMINLDPISTMGARDLQRIAATEGHASQRRAIEELTRRSGRATPADIPFPQ